VRLDEVIAIARRVAVDDVGPNSVRVDAAGEWPRDNLRALQRSGLAGLVVPASAGGLGHGLLAVAHVCELLGTKCASTAISFGMHLVGSAVMSAKATAAHQSRYLEPIARGEHLTTLALSEPGTGAHFYLPESRLRRTSDGYELTGAKSFVTNGAYADSYVMNAAPEASDAAPGEFSCLVVPSDAPGLSWSPPWHGWGMRGNEARSATLDRVRLSQDALLGREGDEIWFVFNVVAPYFIIAMAGTYLGIAEAAIDYTREHLLARSHTHTGNALAANTIIQHRFGTLWAQVQRTRALVLEAARLADGGDPLAMPALCSAKAEVAEAAERVTAEAMSLAGGRGYTEGHPLQRLYRDARAAHVMAPTTDILRTWTGRALLGQPLLGD